MIDGSVKILTRIPKASGPVVEFCWATGEGRLHTPASFNLRIRALVDKGLRMLWDGKALEVGNSRFRAPRRGEHFQPSLSTGAWGFNPLEGVHHGVRGVRDVLAGA